MAKGLIIDQAGITQELKQDMSNVKKRLDHMDTRLEHLETKLDQHTAFFTEILACLPKQRLSLRTETEQK